METNDTTFIKEFDSIKLIKNTKGYSWEIRITCIDIDKLQNLNNEMINRFGGGGDI
jgi:hypothetical protein